MEAAGIGLAIFTIACQYAQTVSLLKAFKTQKSTINRFRRDLKTQSLITNGLAIKYTNHRGDTYKLSPSDERKIQDQLKVETSASIASIATILAIPLDLIELDPTARLFWELYDELSDVIRLIEKANQIDEGNQKHSTSGERRILGRVVNVVQFGQRHTASVKNVLHGTLGQIEEKLVAIRTKNNQISHQLHDLEETSNHQKIRQAITIVNTTQLASIKTAEKRIESAITDKKVEILATLEETKKSLESGNERVVQVLEEILKRNSYNSISSVESPTKEAVLNPFAVETKRLKEARNASKILHEALRSLSGCCIDSQPHPLTVGLADAGFESKTHTTFSTVFEIRQQTGEQIQTPAEFSIDKTGKGYHNCVAATTICSLPDQIPVNSTRPITLSYPSTTSRSTNATFKFITPTVSKSKPFTLRELLESQILDAIQAYRIALSLVTVVARSHQSSWYTEEWSSEDLSFFQFDKGESKERVLERVYLRLQLENECWLEGLKSVSQSDSASEKQNREMKYLPKYPVFWSLAEIFIELARRENIHLDRKLNNLPEPATPSAKEYLLYTESRELFMMQGPYGNVVRDLINLGNGMFPLGLFPEPNFKYKEFQRYFLENFVFKLRDAIRLYEGCFCDQPSDSTDSGEELL